MEQQYQKEYRDFINNYASGVTTGEKVGEIISRLAQYFTEANLNYASSLISFNVKAREIEETVDETSGKTISSSKAKVLADATIESQSLIQAKTHVENIEMCINSLKSLQKGILTEFSQGNLT